MKKNTLKQTFLKEDHKLDNVNRELSGFKSLVHGQPEKTDLGKVNQELGGFKSLVHGDPGSKAPAKHPMDKELDSAKWELSEDFDLDMDDSFSDEFSTKKDGEEQSHNTGDEIEENVITIDSMAPMDELEHVSLVMNPNDYTAKNPKAGQVDPETASTTFSAPGGPGFEKSTDDSDKEVLFDGDQDRKRALVTEMDPFNEYDPTPKDGGFGPDDEDNEDWENYLAEPENQEKHEPTKTNDLKSRIANFFKREAKEPVLTKKQKLVKENVEVLKSKLLEEIKKLK
jgi:hypothetical protein